MKRLLDMEQNRSALLKLGYDFVVFKSRLKKSMIRFKKRLLR
ncbi:hypothetical protein [Costertonia aggregata]|nr:hypothetical protein [Costertonia aggregata]